MSPPPPATTPETGSPDTSAETSSNRDDHSRVGSLSSMHDDDASSSVESGNHSHKSTLVNDEIAKRQQHIAWTRCAALFLLLVIAAGAGAATYVLTSTDQDQNTESQVGGIYRICTVSFAP